MQPNEITTIIIVNWNANEDTIQCLKSVLQISYSQKSVNIVIVDNNSSDNSYKKVNKYLRDNDGLEECKNQQSQSSTRIKEVSVFNSNIFSISKVILIRAYKNYGFSGGNNIGLKYSSSYFKSDYFWILNNDTLITKGALSSMIKRFKEDENICICGSTILRLDDKKTVQCYGGSFYSLFSGRGWSYKEGTKYDANINNSLVESKINYICGASMILKASFIKRINYFCEDYFLYNEEIDLTMRLNENEKIAVATDAIIYHKIGAAIGTNTIDSFGSKLASFYQSRSKLIFAKKHTKGNYFFVYLFLLARSLKFLLNKDSFANGVVILSVLLGKKKPNQSWFIR